MSENKKEIIENNNSSDENKKDTQNQQNKNINKKKTKKNTNKTNSSKLSKNVDSSNKDNNVINENNTSNDEKQDHKEKIRSIIKEQNDLLTKEREYLKIIENLKIKIKNLEESNKHEIDKITIDNTEKEKCIKVISSTNEKMKQSFNSLTQRLEQFSKNLNLNKKSENPKNPPIFETQPKISEKNNLKQKISDKDDEIKKQLKLINILSKENQDIKKNINRYYDLDIYQNKTKELKEKEELKAKLENVIEEYEKIVKIHNDECSSTIKNLQEELKNIQKQLDIEKNKFHNKNKDYILMQCKVTLSKKEKEEEYKKLINKHNFLIMNKKDDTFNYEDYLKEKYIIRKKFCLNVEKEKPYGYKLISLPKIDFNNEKKIISPLFNIDEMYKLKIIYIEEYQDENKLEIFLNKINEIEKGNCEENELDDLNEENLELEKEIREFEELMTIEEFKIKEKKYENYELNKKYKILLKKNLLLKNEEKKLTNAIKYKNEKQIIKIKQDKKKQEIDNMLNDINKISIEDDDSRMIKSNHNEIFNEEKNYYKNNKNNINNNGEIQEKNNISSNMENSDKNNEEEREYNEEEEY